MEEESSESEELNDKMDEENKYKYIIPHYAPLKVYWDLFIMSLAIWNSFMIPIEVSFEPVYM